MKSIQLIALVLTTTILSACMKPPEGKAIKENMREILPNETAFLVPLEGSTSNQKQLQSVEYWQKQMVATKRIEVPVRWLQTGRLNHVGEWIPTHKVITVDRTMVSREWAMDPGQGTTNTNQSIGVESVESIGIYLDIVLNAVITEENAPTYLYWYGAKQLPIVVDENVRNEATQLLSAEFGRLTLDECRKEKGTIVERVREQLTKSFEERGITIVSFGIQGGLQYEDPEIQESINKQFKSENQLVIAENDRKRQEIDNARLFSIAENERKMAEERAKAIDAYEVQRNLDILEAAVAKWQGQVPNFLMLGKDELPADFLMQLPAK